jgi:uncharacterized protein YkwD
MDIDSDADMATRLRRLDAVTETAAPFAYDGMVTRHAARQAGQRRRRNLARGTAGALVFALVGASLWRFERDVAVEPASAFQSEAFVSADPQPRIVRADTYLAVAALEDHIASVDDALNEARAYAPHGADVARLELARNELLDSYARVRYAEMVSANF